MFDDRKIPLPVIRRLPRYYRYLGDLMDAGIKRISSKELSERMNITASQIRQDLNNFGCFGQQGYGYNIEYLYYEIKRILGIDKAHNLILIGAGKIGRALCYYRSFENRGFKFIAAFDKVNIGDEINGIPVLNINGLEEYLQQTPVDIAVLAVPGASAQELVERLRDGGVRGIWNFAPVDLDTEIPLENVNLADSLMSLIYRLGRV